MTERQTAGRDALDRACEVCSCPEEGRWVVHQWGECPRRSVPRVVSHFSCGVASAVATKLALFDRGHEGFVILNAFIAEEHPDNQRFLADCERWFEHPIVQVRDAKFGASALEVWRRERFIKSGKWGASCSRALKRGLLAAHSLPHDAFVLGFTVEEQDRLDRFYDANAGRKVLTPLIDRNLTKADCLAMVERAGIELPAMYRLGYANNNCIGCCKGGMGYWNKIRRDFPDRFNEVADIEEMIGPAAYLFRDAKTGVRFPLRQLPPNAGRHVEPDIECSTFCMMAEWEIDSGVAEAPSHD